MTFSRTCSALIMGLTWCLIQPGLAAFSLVDNFESYSLGTSGGGSTAFLANGGPWQPRALTGDSAGSSLVEVFNSAGSVHLAGGWNSADARGAYRQVTTIGNGSAAWYYFDMRFDHLPDTTSDYVTYGLSDISSPASFTGFADFEVEVGFGRDAGGGLDLVANNGGSYQTLATSINQSTWYGIWLYVDNATDVFDVYLGSGRADPDTNFDPDTLGSLVGSNLGFRNGASSNDLTTFMFIDGNVTGNEGVRLDNLYYQAVPEPGSWILIAASGLLLLRRRR